jgi:ribonuclease BN (tRNA processing enzyme)
LLFPGTPARVREHVPVNFVELLARTTSEIEGLSVTPFPVRHPSGAPSHALRVAIGDKIVTFSGDAEWDDVLVEASAGADVFVCECTAYREKVPFHISLPELQSHASELTARRVVLAHLGREMLRHANEAPWPCVVDGEVIEL